MVKCISQVSQGKEPQVKLTGQVLLTTEDLKLMKTAAESLAFAGNVVSAMTCLVKPLALKCGSKKFDKATVLTQRGIMCPSWRNHLF